MSLKDNINFIKEDISTEEKFFEGFFKVEKIWAKYKKAIIALVSLTVIGFIGTNVSEYLNTQNNIKANNAFNSLVKNPSDSIAMENLKSTNPKLLEIAQYLISQKDNKSEVYNLEFIKEISEFNIASKNQDIESINKVILNSTFLLKEYAIFQKALIQALNENFVDAKETLKLIPQISPIYELSSKLNHYLLTK